MKRCQTACARGITVLALVLSTPYSERIVSAQEPPPKLKKFELTASIKGRARPFFANYTARRGRAFSVDNPNAEVFVAAQDPFHGHVDYPNLAKGDIVPMFGYLYRVTGKYANILEWIPNDRAPKGSSVRHDSVVVPLRRGRSGYLGYAFGKMPDGQDIHHIFLVAVGSDPKRKAGTVASVKYNSILNKAEVSRVGDILRFGTNNWLIRNIVPYDRERHLIGWMELSPQRRIQRPALVIREGMAVTLKAVDPKSLTKPPEAWISTTFRGKDGKLWNSGIWTRETGMERFGVPNGPPRTIQLSLPAVKRGDVVPFRGRIYRVASLDPDKIGLRDADATKFPKNLTPKRGSLLVPLLSPRGGQPPMLSSRPLSRHSLTHIIADPDYDRDGGHKRLVMRAYGDHEQPERRVTLTEGRSYGLLKWFYFKVIRIVPRDEKHGSIGWVEVSPSDHFLRRIRELKANSKR